MAICVSQYLHFNCVLGTVQAVAICPLRLQVRHALTPDVAPEALIVRCLNSSDIREVLSILTMRLRTVSHVVFESIASWTFTRTLFSWIVFNRQMMSTSSGVIENPSQLRKSSTTVWVVADCDWPGGGEYRKRSNLWSVRGITDDVMYVLMSKSALSTVSRLS